MIDDLLTTALKSEDRDIEKVKQEIDWLIAEGFVESITVDGDTKYRLTRAGRKKAKEIHNLTERK